MKILRKDLKQGIVKLETQNNDDLWYLSQIISQNDLVKGKTERKVKFGGEHSTKTAKKTVTLTIEVERVEFHKYTNALRIMGKVAEETEDIPKGSYHTLNVDDNASLTITKQKWLSYQLDKLEESTKVRHDVIICIFDREEVMFVALKGYGYDILSEMKGEVQKKDDPSKISSTFYQDIISKLEEYDRRIHPTKIIVASPAFWKEYLKKHIEITKLKNKVYYASCSSVGKEAIEEILKRKEVITTIHDDRTLQEINLVDELLLSIKQEKAAYGIAEVEKMADIGAIEKLLVSDGYIEKTQEKNNYFRVENILKRTDSIKGKVHIISSDHDGGKKLDGLGGIGAVLRYKI